MNLNHDLDEWVRAQLVGVPEDLRKPVAVRTAQAAGIDPFAALEAVNRLDSARERARQPGKVRAPSRTRLQRAEARPDRETGRQYVRATALDPFLVTGAKPRATTERKRVNPGSTAKKWRISAAAVPQADACCTCLPGVLSRLHD